MPKWTYRSSESRRAAGPKRGTCATSEGTNLALLDADAQKALRRRGMACRPLVPHSPCGTPRRASPTPASRDCIHPFERRLRLCDPEVATANSSWELAVGSSSNEKSTVGRAPTVAAIFIYMSPHYAARRRARAPCGSNGRAQK